MPEREGGEAPDGRDRAGSRTQAKCERAIPHALRPQKPRGMALGVGGPVYTLPPANEASHHSRPGANGHCIGMCWGVLRRVWELPLGTSA